MPDRICPWWLGPLLLNPFRRWRLKPERLLRPWVRLLATRPYGRVVAALAMAAREDPAFAQRYLERFISPRREAGREILERARRRGELRADTDVEVALDLIYGPIYHRLLHGHAPLSQRFVEQLVDAVLSGLGGDQASARTPSSRRSTSRSSL